jgi:hypothetical protein
LLAQPAFVRPDDEDFRIIPPPMEVISWGIGTFAVGKASINTTTSFNSDLTSSPALFLERSAVAGTSTFRGIDVRPVIDYGLTFYAPTLFTLFGRNWGVNLDVYLASYRFVTQFYTLNLLQEPAKSRFNADNARLNTNNLAAASAEHYPKFVTTLRYLNVAPMLNISGFLIGANIGIPMPLMAATLSTPNSNILPLQASTLAFPTNELQLIVEPRIGIMAPLVSTRSGSFNFLATLGWMLPNASALRSESLLQRSNTIMTDAVRSWAGASDIASPFARDFDKQAITPLSLSLGFSYIFTFGNAALIDDFEREAYTTDSIRAYYATITRTVDSLRAISTRLADSMANAIIASSRVRDTLTKLQQVRALDSVNKAQEQRVFAERERRNAVEKEKLALENTRKGLEAQKQELEAQKRELESKNKKKDKELAQKIRELADKQRLVEEKQRLVEEKNRVIEETKQRVFEAKIGAIIGINDDGSETPQNPTIRVEEFAATHVKSLVPRVFFDKGSSIIPIRYKQINSSDRNTYQVPTNPNEKSTVLHGQILNIVAKRLLANPSAQITLTGFKRDDEFDPKLSLKRAEAVASYFIDRWKIPSSRIIRESGRSGAESPSDASGKAMSVLLSSEDASVCAPFTASDVTRTATPPAIAIGLDITTGAGLKQWQLEVRQIINNQDELLTDTTGNKVVSRVVWNLADDVLSIPRSEEEVNIRIEAFDTKNAKAPESPVKELKVEQITLAKKKAAQKPDKTLYFYDLVFEGSVTNLLGQQNILLNEMKSRLTPGASAKITVFNPTGVSGNAADIAQMLGLEANNVKLVNTENRLNQAQTLESAAYNNLVRIRIEAPNK